MAERHPMTPAEFDAASRELVRQAPWLWETSWYRSEKRNKDKGGDPKSKHLIGMARDYGAPDSSALHQAAQFALKLGMWVRLHDAGTGFHLHTQGLPVGEIPEWWSAKYL